MLFANALTVLNRFQNAQWAHYVPLLFQALVDASALPLEKKVKCHPLFSCCPKRGIEELRTLAGGRLQSFSAL